MAKKIYFQHFIGWHNGQSSDYLEGYSSGGKFYLLCEGLDVVRCSWRHHSKERGWLNAGTVRMQLSKESFDSLCRNSAEGCESFIEQAKYLAEETSVPAPRNTINWGLAMGALGILSYSSKIS